MPRTRTSGQGRPKGAMNRHTKALKEMILGALDSAGGEKWLLEQARENPTAFIGLIGRVLPREMKHEGGESPIVTRTEIVFVDPSESP